MPFRRPISPLSLETVPTPQAEIGDLLGSDDELDESAREAKRRRIERLGESYLKGQPLFILSASLRGPFDNSWVNPWTKNRKHATVSKRNKKNRHRTIDLSEQTAIPETDPKKRKLQNVSESKSARPRNHGFTVYSSSPIPENDLHNPNATDGGVRQRVGGQISEGRTNPDTTPSSVPRSSDRSVYLEPTSFVREPGLKPWLKRDGRKMDIFDINPPKSPTMGKSRQRDAAEHMARTKISRTSVVLPNRRNPAPDASPGVSRSRKTSSTSNIIRKDINYLRAQSYENVRHHSTPASGEPAGYTPSKISREEREERIIGSVKRARLSEDRNDNDSSHYDQVEIQAEAAGNNRSDNHGKRLSLHIVPPSSHLPEFEYRRPKNNKSFKGLPSRPASSGETGTERNSNKQGTGTSSNQRSSSVRGFSIYSNQPKAISESRVYPTTSREYAGNEPEPPSPSPAPISALTMSTSRNVEFTSTDGIQSAQEVPGIVGSRDQLISLRSTNVPEHNTAESDNDADPQLSTQAALLLAQKSFQDDLATPEREIKPDPGSGSSNFQSCEDDNSRVSIGITPFHQLSTPAREPTGDSPVTVRRGEFHAISTQCMIDAVTPFTFSSSKKSGAPLSSLKRLTTSAKAQRAGFATSPPGSPDCASPSLMRHTRIQGGPPSDVSKADADRESGVEQETCKGPRDGQSDSQFTALPFTLSGSTPTTAQQDGQGPAMDMGTFDLSQAIEDAGSWLQQSWDVNRDLKQCSSKSAPSSSSQAHPPAVGIDAVS